MDEPLTETEPAASQAEPEETREAASGGEAPRERRSRGWLLLKAGSVAVVVVVLSLLAWATLAAGRGKSLVAQVAAGEKPAAPSFELPVLSAETANWPRGAIRGLADGRLSLDELRGYPVVLNFWASWCIACRDEAPILHASAVRHRGKVAFLGLDTQDLSSDALGFIRKYKVNYVTVREQGDGFFRRYGLTGVPETFFIDARGRVVEHIPGAVSADTLEEGIDAAVRGGRAG